MRKSQEQERDDLVKYIYVTENLSRSGSGGPAKGEIIGL